MKNTLLILVFLYGINVLAQTIEYKNFYSEIEGKGIIDASRIHWVVNGNTILKDEAGYYIPFKLNTRESDFVDNVSITGVLSVDNDFNYVNVGYDEDKKAIGSSSNAGTIVDMNLKDGKLVVSTITNSIFSETIFSNNLNEIQNTKKQNGFSSALTNTGILKNSNGIVFPVRSRQGIQNSDKYIIRAIVVDSNNNYINTFEIDEFTYAKSVSSDLKVKKIVQGEYGYLFLLHNFEFVGTKHEVIVLQTDENFKKIRTKTIQLFEGQLGRHLTPITIEKVGVNYTLIIVEKTQSLTEQTKYLVHAIYLDRNLNEVGSNVLDIGKNIVITDIKLNEHGNFVAMGAVNIIDVYDNDYFAMEFNNNLEVLWQTSGKFISGYNPTFSRFIEQDGSYTIIGTSVKHNFGNSPLIEYNCELMVARLTPPPLSVSSRLSGIDIHYQNGNLEIKNIDNKDLVLIDISGRIIRSWDNLQLGSYFSYNMNSLPSGLYLVKVGNSKSQSLIHSQN